MKAGTRGVLMADHERKAVAGRTPDFHVIDNAVELPSGWASHIQKVPDCRDERGRCERLRQENAVGNGLRDPLIREGARYVDDWECRIDQRACFAAMQPSILPFKAMSVTSARYLTSLLRRRITASSPDAVIAGSKPP